MISIQDKMLYGREVWKMSKDKKSNYEKKSFIVTVVSVCVTVVCTIFTIVGVVYTYSSDKQQRDLEMNSQYTTISTQLDGIVKNIGELKSDVSELKLDVEELQIRVTKLETNVGNLQSDVDMLKQLRYSALVPSEDLKSNITVSKEDDFYLRPIALQAGEIVANNKYTGESFTREDLAGEKLLLPYKEAGQEVFFYGQFNENGQWDGNCIINVYKDDKLILITDANYINGEVDKYKQVIIGTRIWYSPERRNMGSFNEGVTWSYYKDDEIIKDFSIDTVKSTDIINIETFINQNNLRLEGYYHGRTSDGEYNDDTGEAYLIKFAEDGTVRTLYVGGIVKGEFFDETGNAWYITKEENTDYMYYRGIFKEGKPERNEGSIFLNPYTLAEIERCIAEYEFDIELHWYQEQIL